MDQARGSGVTTGDVRGTFLVTGVRARGVHIGFGGGGFFTAPRLSRTSGRADAVGIVNIPTEYRGSGQVSGTASGSGPSLSSATTTVTETFTTWAKGTGDVSLTTTNVMIR